MQFSFSLKYGRNQRRTTQFYIGIHLLGPDPTSSKNKAELIKNSQVARFVNLSEDQLQQILAERHLLGTEQTPTGHQQHLRVKFTFSPAITRQITQEDINLLLTKTTAARSSQEAVMTSQCSQMNISLKKDDSRLR